MKRLNKEYRLDVCNHAIVKYGSVNKDNPQVVYVSGKCWVSPKNSVDYKSVVSLIEKDMRKNIRMFLADGVNFNEKFILDFDLNYDKLSVGEKKFLSFDFYLKQSKDCTKTLGELKGVLSSKVSTIVNSLVFMFKENGFDVKKTKSV